MKLAEATDDDGEYIKTAVLIQNRCFNNIKV
jgi:hypothetical protein